LPVRDLLESRRFGPDKATGL